jgi:protein TonB
MRGKLGGVAGSLLTHGLLALAASLSLTHAIRGTGRGPAGTLGNGEGEAGAALVAFDVGVRQGQPDLEVPKGPETLLFGKVSSSESPEAEPLETPETPIDPLAESASARDPEPPPLDDLERLTPRPPSARELLPKGLPGGTGDAPEGSLASEGASSVSRPGNGPSGVGTGSGGSGDGSLVAVYRPKPPYPPSARRRNIEGASLVEIQIDPAGAVTDARLLESSGSEALDEAALETAKKWKYERKSSGVPLLPITEKIRFVFRLTD